MGIGSAFGGLFVPASIFALRLSYPKMIIARVDMRLCNLFRRCGGRVVGVALLGLFGFMAGTGAWGADHSPPAIADASTFPDVEVHDQEKVAVAADPYDTKTKCKLLRVDYNEYDILPVRVIITNNSDKPISLEQARIHFITADGSKIPAAEPEDVERRVSSASNRGKTIPLPGPLPSIHTAPGKRNTQIEEDFHDFELQAWVVEAHTTRAGFLFYDVSGFRDPLKGGKLYLRKLRNDSGQDLFYFEVPFDKYLDAQPK